MSTRDGGPAFPRAGQVGEGIWVDQPGNVTLREWFAGKALPSVIWAYIEANGHCLGTEHITSNCAAHAYRFADAMLAERAKVKP